MYKAKVIQANNIVDHPNADKMNLLIYNGEQFVVGKDLVVGTTVVLFPSDGQLSHEFCANNNLYRDATKNSDKLKSGFFDDNRRVKAQGFRGQKSYGYVAELKQFDYIKGFSVNIGDEISEFGKNQICQKYYTQATLDKMNRVKNNQKKIKDVEYSLKENYDTEKFSYNIPNVEFPTICIISEKAHGTSAITGHVKVTRRVQNFVQKILSKITKKFIGKEITNYEYVSGTRRTICNRREDITTPGQQDYYRWQWHEKISPQLNKGETIYYEICGWDSHGGTIMDRQDLNKLQDKKNVSKSWLNPMIYSYGCNEGENRVFVYRITQTSESDSVVDLSWMQIKARCKDLGLETVKVLDIFMPKNTEELVSKVKSYMTDSSSTIDEKHLMEGICIRLETPNGIKVLKEKNFMFGILEGYLKENTEYVDTEEVN